MAPPECFMRDEETGVKRAEGAHVAALQHIRGKSRRREYAAK